MTWKDAHDPLLNKQNRLHKSVSGWPHFASTSISISADKLTTTQKAVHQKDMAALSSR